MGFDNECILNIQSLPGEYFCPVCRTLVYPNEALQTQCTHLYCKSCLAYVVATTQACPYDGYLVTEADSKPLMESNKTLAETIGKVAVYCLYNKSGCQWHGELSACTTHGTTCAYGNSPVVCNRCGTQIVHRQVQEHAQLCHGLQSQTQQADGSQVQLAAATTQPVTQDPSLASAGSAAPAVTTLPKPSLTTATAVTSSATATGGAAGATTAAVPSSAASISASQTPTAEQWYQQQQQLQYSQYYQQQHPGSNPYMQQYQQYNQYQQAYQHYMQPSMQVPSQNVVQGSAQPASYVQPQVQSSQLMMQAQSQPQVHPLTSQPQLQQHPVQPHPQSHPHLSHVQLPADQSQLHQSIQSAQVPQFQPSHVPLQPSGLQVQPAAHPSALTQVGNQQVATQATAHQVQPHVRVQPPQQQHIVAQQQHPHLQALPPHQNIQPQMQLNSQVQLQPPHAQQQAYPQPQAYPQQTHHMHPQNASSQSVQPYQQGMSSSQQVHSQPGQPYTQHHVTGNTGHVQTSAGRSMTHLAPTQQFQHQQSAVLRTESPAAAHPIGQGSLDLEKHTSKSGKSENAINAAVSENKISGADSAAMRPTKPQSGEENMNSEQNGFVGVRKDAVQTGIVSHGLDGSIRRDGNTDQAGNSHGLVVQGGKDHKASDVTNREKEQSFQQASLQNAGALGSYVPPGVVPQHPSGPDKMLPQHIMNPGHKHGSSENIRPPLQQPYGLFHSGKISRPFGENQIQMPMSQPGGIRPGDGMIRPPVVGPLPGHHGAVLSPFDLEHLGMLNSNDFGGEGFNTSRGAAYPGRHDNIEDDRKHFPAPALLDGQGLQRDPRHFERALVRPDGFLDSVPGRPPFPNHRSVGLHEGFPRKQNTTASHPDVLSHGAEFDHHRAIGMPNFRNPGPFAQGTSGGPGAPPKNQLGSGDMHPGDPHLVADYSQHGFPKTAAHFGLGGFSRNGNSGWCRICMFNCGTAENLDLHVQTREHQQCAMDIILKMKQDVAKRKKLNYGGPKSVNNKKVSGKGHFRGNRR
ncbi:hypothetical protein ZEAMMB73_Zm00001d011427 [Zea mays]|uniref:Uncharacterized protein n=1 Tax=Zea mays TaxID=4577 RepID=A0A1D6G028_MAIZE|nr:hypothetical protein ZEAMMB73_Zm00001d011427 [Zea mays]